MRNLSTNDTWILRTLAKLDCYIKAEHQNFYDEFIALRTHINKMTFINRKTELRDVYFLLREVAVTYKEGVEQFSTYFETKKVNYRVAALMKKYQSELATVQ